MMGWYSGGMGPLGWRGMGVFWLLLLALIVWLVVRLLRAAPARRPVGGRILACQSRLRSADEPMFSGRAVAI